MNLRWSVRINRYGPSSHWLLAGRHTQPVAVVLSSIRGRNEDETYEVRYMLPGLETTRGHASVDAAKKEAMELCAAWLRDATA